uniref:Protein quiver n=1 Tax=Panagrellus redivivus TaxID=6233 RepID=A0A7E4UWA8_PANRE
MRSISIVILLTSVLLPVVTSKISCYVDRHGGIAEDCDYCGFLNLTARVGNQTYTDVNFQCYSTIGIIGGLLIPRIDMCQKTSTMGYNGAAQTVESYICFDNLCNSFCNAAVLNYSFISIMLTVLAIIAIKL